MTYTYSTQKDETHRLFSKIPEMVALFTGYQQKEIDC